MSKCWFELDGDADKDVLLSLPAGATPGFDGDKAAADAAADHLRDELSDLQARLYAEQKHTVLIVLQAMDTGGKDSTIRAVLGPLNPQGVRVWNFKVPTPAELRHDFLWRVHRRVPGGGYIGVFNRSHYEDVVVVRVKGLAPEEVWRRRYEHINAFEKLLHDEGVQVVKFFLHISKDYQRERLLRRLRKKDKQWKFDPQDLKERARWDDYQHAYETAIGRCSTAHAPWYVVPAEERWFRNLLVATVLVDLLDAMQLEFPRPTFDPGDIRVD